MNVKNVDKTKDRIAQLENVVSEASDLVDELNELVVKLNKLLIGTSNKNSLGENMEK